MVAMDYMNQKAAYNRGVTDTNAKIASEDPINNMTERQFSKYMTDYEHKLNVKADSEKYQRAYNDIKKTGLNPRLILDSLDPGNIHTSSAYQYSESKGQSKSESSSNSFASSSIITGILLFLAALL